MSASAEKTTQSRIFGLTGSQRDELARSEFPSLLLSSCHPTIHPSTHPSNHAAIHIMHGVLVILNGISLFLLQGPSEIFRYVPGSDPPSMAYDIPGIQVDVSLRSPLYMKK